MIITITQLAIHSFLSAVETFILYWLGVNLLKFNKKQPLASQLSFALYFIFQLISYISQAPLFSTAIYYIAFTLIVIFFSFEGPIKKKILIVQLFVITNYACKLLATMLQLYYEPTKSVSHIPSHIIQTPFSQLTASLFALIIITFFIFFQQMRRKRRSAVYIAIKYSLPTMIIFICIKLFYITLHLNYFYLYILGILYSIAVIIFYLIDATDMIDEEANQTRIATTMLQMQKDYYTAVEKSQKDVIALRHDFRKHLHSLSSLLRLKHYEEALQYVNQIYDETTHMRVPIVGGNSMINILLNDCQMRAKAAHINVSINVMVPTQLPINNTDVCIVLGNLIDNSIEACERIPKESSLKKYIKLDIRLIKNFLFIKAINSFDGVLERDGNVFKTLKTGNFHGVGLANIHRVVEKYEGTIKLDPLGNEFKATIMIPLNEATTP